MDFGVLNGDCLAGGGEVEHVEDDGRLASVLAAMNGADHLDQSFSLTESAFFSVDADDGEVTLFNDAVVDDSMVMPARFGSGGESQAADREFGPSDGEIGQLRAVPALGGTDEFSDCNSVAHSVLMVVCRSSR